MLAYTPQTYAPSDLDVFARNFTPNAVGYRPQLASIDGGTVPLGTPSFEFNGEGNLDVQYSVGLTYPLNITLYQVGGTLVRVSR